MIAGMSSAASPKLSPAHLALIHRMGPAEVSALVIERLRRGMTIHGACSELGVDSHEYRQWLAERPDHQALVRRVSEDAAEQAIAEIIPIADDRSTDTARARLMVDARVTVAEKLDPRRWGRREHHTLEAKPTSIEDIIAASRSPQGQITRGGGDFIDRAGGTLPPPENPTAPSPASLSQGDPGHG